MKRLGIHIGVSATALLLLYGQLFFWQDPFLGWLSFVVYFFVVGSLWQDIFVRVFRMRRGRSVTLVYALFAALVLLGCVAGIFVVWYTLTPFLLWVSYIVSMLVPAIFLCITRKTYKKKIPEVQLEKAWHSVPREWTVFRGYRILSLVYIMVSILLAALLILSGKHVVEVSSPWQVLHAGVLPVWFFLTALLGFLLFAKYRVPTLLLFVVIHSLLTHAFLPAAQALPWGGDAWRHMAAEQKIISGEFLLPVAVGPEARWREVLGADIPEAFVIPHKYVYGQFWATMILLAETLRVDLVTLHIWLLPILWSVVLPFLLFRIGRVLFGSWRSGLRLAWLLSLFFPFQALGSLSLPVSLGFLAFLFVLVLWLQYLRERRYAQRNIVLLFAILFLFGYTLYFFLIWLVIACSFFIRKIIAVQQEWIRWGLMAALTFAGMLFFPALELVAGISAFPVSWDWLGAVKQFVGQFSGWYYASAIRPHDILSGNIFFNHTPASAFVSTAFTDWRWHVIPVMMLLFVGAIYGYIRLLRKEDSLQWRVLGLFGGTVFFGYVCNWFFLVGDRSFVRRLDIMVGFLVAVFFFLGFSAFRDSMGAGNGRNKRIVVAACILLLSWFGTTAYAGGPDMRAVSGEEYEAAKYIWGGMNDADQNAPCVLADTWVLLPLESLSAGKIVGGGLPIDAQFGQQERVGLLLDMTTQPDEEAIQRAHKLTQAQTCWFAFDRKKVSEEVRNTLAELFGSEPVFVGQYVVHYGNTLVWKNTLKEE